VSSLYASIRGVTQAEQGKYLHAGCGVSCNLYWLRLCGQHLPSTHVHRLLHANLLMHACEGMLRVDTGPICCQFQRNAAHQYSTANTDSAAKYAASTTGSARRRGLHTRLSRPHIASAAAPALTVMLRASALCCRPSKEPHVACSMVPKYVPLMQHQQTTRAAGHPDQCPPLCCAYLLVQSSGNRSTAPHHV